MKPYILEGTPHDVAQRIERLSAARITAMLVVEEDVRPGPSPQLSDADFARLWAESESDAVAVGHVDDSRQAIYTRMPGE